MFLLAILVYTHEDDSNLVKCRDWKFYHNANLK